MRSLQWYKRGAAYEPLTYFSDTSMILYVKRNEKYHLCNVLFISLIAKNLMQK